MTIETVSEVSGRIEIQTSKQTSKIKKPEGLKPKNPKARHRDLQKEKDKIEEIAFRSILPLGEKIDSFIECTERMENMREWETGSESDVNSLQWKWELGAFQ